LNCRTRNDIVRQIKSRRKQFSFAIVLGYTRPRAELSRERSGVATAVPELGTMLGGLLKKLGSELTSSWRAPPWRPWGRPPSSRPSWQGEPWCWLLVACEELRDPRSDPPQHRRAHQRAEQRERAKQHVSTAPTAPTHAPHRRARARRRRLTLRCGSAAAPIRDLAFWGAALPSANYYGNRHSALSSGKAWILPNNGPINQQRC
jgi:hypothetical protein